MKNDHSYIYYKIERCHESTRNLSLLDPTCHSKSGYECLLKDPECASPEAINEWTSQKRAIINSINNKIAYKNFEHYIRQNELRLPSIPLKAGKFSDTGYRFRKNSFTGLDHWAPMVVTKEDEFYDYLFYSTDVMDVNPVENNLIAKLHFRIDTDKIEHDR